MSDATFYNKKKLSLWVSILAGVAVGAGCCFFFTPKSVIKHVVLISMDTTRADHLSCYGYPQRTTPHIDAVAEEGVLFENVIAPAPLTLPSHSSMLTGTLPPYHGVLDNRGYKLGKDNVTLAEILKENGFSTAGFVSSFVLDSQFGLAQGMDYYDDEFENDRNTMGIAERTGDETTRHVIEWLEKERGGKNFIFLHYFDPHYSYTPPEPFASAFKYTPQEPWVKLINDPTDFNGYPGEIAYIDHCIGQVLQKLKELDMYDSSLIIITSDHGESLGEHKERTHGYFIYESTVRVPLVIKVPGHNKPQTINEIVSLVDILPTVCSLLDIQWPAEIQGENLAPYLAGQQHVYPDRAVLAQSLGPTVYLANSLLGVMDNQYKYIQTTRPELYDLIADPYEIHNLYAAGSNRGRIMKDRLEQILELSVPGENRLVDNVQLDEANRRRLEALGYVGRITQEDFSFDQSKEDPKDLIDYHNVHTTLGPLVAGKKFADAYNVCNELIAMRPDFCLPYFDMAKILVEDKKYTEAIVYLQKALERKPDYVDAYKELADIYKTQGNTDEAVQLYAKMLELEPDNVRFYFDLAELLYDLGRYNEADDYLTHSLTQNPSYTDMAMSLAEKLLEKQQFKLAYTHYLRILQVNPESANVLNSLAWLESASSIKNVYNPEQGLKHALLACELTQHQRAEFMDTLAVAYAAVGDFGSAIATAEKAEALAIQDNNKGLAQRIHSRLRLYQSGQVFVDPQL